MGRYNPTLENALLAGSGLLQVVGSDKIQTLKAMYNGEGRYYHTWDHMLDVLSQTMAHGLGFNSHLAALFHDAVYDVTAKDNEAQSMNLMVGMLKTGDYHRQTLRLIETTARHGEAAWANTTPDERSFLDCDIAIMASESWERVAHEDWSIHKEYMEAHSVEDVIQGRRAFLTNWLKKPVIFLSPQFAHHEWQIRSNIYRLSTHDHTDF